ncbi:hypothetical protein BU24DRAFT_248484 [Aaosphaeria arxii CBS 175.79]|uniref:Uncharacterized protein n=1 Tax=Aaosphaeria arxii CBS 175.79 TaxID=1450172 RepID=A0A6A5XLL7_9PLEO|nr:uncharacterized protein BU24DRAFT_248484 [Aaosphaeria arxii CBS 175.79]KAF2013843.1 hypothetical protein BU24DRAFT_248484 [Aaosphaeria arxii CBS 175.79]
MREEGSFVRFRYERSGTGCSLYVFAKNVYIYKTGTRTKCSTVRSVVLFFSQWNRMLDILQSQLTKAPEGSKAGSQGLVPLIVLVYGLLCLALGYVCLYFVSTLCLIPPFLRWADLAPG